MDDRLPTDLWVSAHIRRCDSHGIATYVVHKGAATAGTVVVKVVARNKGCRLFSQTRNENGVLGWMDLNAEGYIEDTKADAYIAKAISLDPDLWVIEVEDREGKNPFDGPVFS